MNNKRAMHKFRIFEIMIIFFKKMSDIALLWSQITIFIIEITLKQLLHKKYGWNNPNLGRLGLKSPKLHFLVFWQLKIHRIYKKFKYMSRAQFSSELDFF